MDDVDPRLASALAIQLGRRRLALESGAEHVGWKLGVGARERIGNGPVVGHLTSESQLATGGTYRAGDALRLHADAEVALELGGDVSPDTDEHSAGQAIAGYGAALEIVDLSAPDDAEAIVAGNVFHRAFAFGPVQPSLPSAALEGRLVVNGAIRCSAAAPRGFAHLICSVARVLQAVGARLYAGDRLITGAVVQASVAPGDAVVADFGALGQAQLTIAN